MTVTRTVRIDDELQAQVKQAASEDERSLNGEITWVLKVGLEERKRLWRRAYMEARWPGGGIPDGEMGEVLNAFDTGPSSPKHRAAHEAAMAQARRDLGATRPGIVPLPHDAPDQAP